MPLSAEKPTGTLSARSRIYRYLYQSRDFCSKQTLARGCEISMPTLYQNLGDLMADGLVRYSGEGQSTGGRRAQGIDIVPDARIAVGISITEHHLRLAAVDLRLRELAYQRVPFDLVARLPDDAAGIAETLEAFLDAFHLDRGKLLGVGITIPGILTPAHDRIAFAPTLGLRDVPLDELTRQIPYPVWVDNDGSASGHAEVFFRGGQQNLAYLSLENGIGGAVLMGGQPYPGDRDRSGEFGHICVEPGGLRCSCGRSGCLEPYCSARRIENEFGVDLDAFFLGVEQHVPNYETLLFDMLRHLAIAVNNIHMILDCDVVLGGFFSEYLQPYLPILKHYVMAGNPFAESSDFVQLSAVPRHITSLGAALYFVRRFVDSI